jgi:hypothetical protein
MLTPVMGKRPKVMWPEVNGTYYVGSVGPPFEPGGSK